MNPDLFSAEHLNRPGSELTGPYPGDNMKEEMGWVRIGYLSLTVKEAPVLPFTYTFQMYRHLSGMVETICSEAYAEAKIRGLLRHAEETDLGPIPAKGAQAGKDSESKDPAALFEDMRKLVKEAYGDAYDVLSVSCPGAALRLAFTSAFSPPEGPKPAYRAGYITLWEKCAPLQTAFGSPFPPWYERLILPGRHKDGSCRLDGAPLTALVVPPQGAVYQNHGISYRPVPLMSRTEPEASLELLAVTAEAHVQTLAGFSSMGYDTPGYGYGALDESRVPLLLKGIGELSDEFGVPYLLNCHQGLPFVGPDISAIGATLAVYDLTARFGPAAGALIVGVEPFVRVLGEAPAEAGPGTGRPPNVTEVLPVQHRALSHIARNKAALINKINEAYSIAARELEEAPEKLSQGIQLSRSYANGAVELNYEGTWAQARGFPIFTEEDTLAGMNPIHRGLRQMGIQEIYSLDGSIYISPVKQDMPPGDFLSDEDIRANVRALLVLLEVTGRHSGFLELKS